MGNKDKIYVDIMALHPEVTGSCFLCVLKLPNGTSKRFLVDCGLFQEEDYGEYNYDFPFSPEKIEFLLLTHNHVDHTGRIPMLYKNGFKGKVYCTEKTKILLPFALGDSCKVLKDVCKRQHRKPLYGDSDVERTIKFTQGIPYRQEIAIDENITATFFENGHLVGASLILLRIKYPGEKDICILFTGDYNSRNTFFEVKDLPKSVTDETLTIITESTYGSTNSKDVVYQFEDKVVNALAENKIIVLPVFSLGRAQEILLKLKEMQENKLIDEDVPIFFDGNLAHKYTKILHENESILESDRRDFLPKDLKWVSKDTREDVLNNWERKIIVTTSGMGTYGPAQIYIPHYISCKKALILFTGYTAENTMGGKLKEAQENELVNLGGIVARKHAEVSYCTEFSAHAKGDEILEFLSKFSNIRAILINHGNSETKERFAERVIDRIDPPTCGIMNRNYFFRLNCWGVSKTMSSKFN